MGKRPREALCEVDKVEDELLLNVPPRVEPDGYIVPRYVSTLLFNLCISIEHFPSMVSKAHHDDDVPADNGNLHRSCPEIVGFMERTHFMTCRVDRNVCNNKIKLIVVSPDA